MPTPGSYFGNGFPWQAIYIMVFQMVDIPSSRADVIGDHRSK